MRAHRITANAVACTLHACTLTEAACAVLQQQCKFQLNFNGNGIDAVARLTSNANVKFGLCAFAGGAGTQAMGGMRGKERRTERERERERESMGHTWGPCATGPA